MTNASPALLIVAFLVAAVAGAVNAIAGGGTLLSFPSLMALGLDSKVANMTSTVGLWPGSLGGAWSFRRELAQGGKEARLFYITSFIGGAVGAWLLLATDTKTFDFLVPWLILAATLLFMAQGAISRWMSARNVPRPTSRRWLVILPFQFLIGVYGGYFGAGIGILMLAGLGLLGIEDIYQRNGIKNIAAVCINGIAIILFVSAAQVNWPIALVMAAGALLGGYLSAGWAKRVGPVWVRRFVIFVGLAAAIWKMIEIWWK
jgi:uncharacterized membrane protein YfcA